MKTKKVSPHGEKIAKKASHCEKGPTPGGRRSKGLHTMKKAPHKKKNLA